MFTLNLLILCYIGFMVYWWAEQGLFSAAIHLVLTVLAGVVALAAWEPLAAMFLSWMPESAWGIGLMLPFGLSLLVMRFALDKLVPGNLQFPHLADRIAGGAFGFLSGFLTTGILVLGMQMMGFASFFGYQPYALDKEGQVVPYTDNRGASKTLWVGVDAGTAGFFGLLSDHAFSPVLTRNTMGVYRKDLVETISLNADTRMQGAHARRSIGHGQVRLLASDEQTLGLAVLDLLPEVLRHRLKSERQTVVVGFGITLPDAGDDDGVVRIKPNQVRLNHSTEDEQYTTAVENAYPVGYIQAGEYVPFGQQEYVRSEVSATKLVVHFVFQVPLSHRPNFIEIKQMRFDLRNEREKATREPVKVASLIHAVARQAEVPASNQTMANRTNYVKKSAALPFPLNKNTLPTGVETQTVRGVGSARTQHFFLRGTASVIKLPGRSLSRNLRVAAVYTQPSAAMVQLRIGPMGNKEKNLYHKITSQSAVNEAPHIVDVNGDIFWAMGYVATKGPAEYNVSIDPRKPVKTMGDMNMGQLSPGQSLILYFQLPKNKVLAQIKHGKHELVNMGYMRLK